MFKKIGLLLCVCLVCACGCTVKKNIIKEDLKKNGYYHLQINKNSLFPVKYKKIIIQDKNNYVFKNTNDNELKIKASSIKDLIIVKIIAYQFYKKETWLIKINVIN